MSHLNNNTSLIAVLLQVWMLLRKTSLNCWEPEVMRAL